MGGGGGGQDEALVGGMSDRELSLAVASHFDRTLPRRSKVSSCTLSAALESVRQARNKVLAHNEAFDKAARTLATWGETSALVEYAKDFACAVGAGFLGIYLGHGHADFMLEHDAKRFAFRVSQLLDRAGLQTSAIENP